MKDMLQQTDTIIPLDFHVSFQVLSCRIVARASQGTTTVEFADYLVRNAGINTSGETVYTIRNKYETQGRLQTMRCG